MFPPEHDQQQEREPEAAGYDYAADWPRKGGFDGPQPWDLKRQGIEVGATDDGVTVVSESGITKLELGARDTVSPIVPAHGRPPLSGLSAGPAVTELGELLGELGYETSVSKGHNPLGVLDDTVATAVERFREDYGVEEDPSQFARGDRSAAAQAHVLAWTWEGLLRAVAHERAEQKDDQRQLAFA